MGILELLFWYLVGTPVGVVLHELAHALAALALGMKLREVVIGRGWKALKFRVGRVRVRLAWRIDSGHVIVGPPRGYAAALRYGLMIAAGPAANIVAAVGLGICGVWSVVNADSSAAIDSTRALFGLALANAALCVHLWRIPDVATAQLRTDPQLLRDLWRAPQEFLAMARVGDVAAEHTHARGSAGGVCAELLEWTRVIPADDYAATVKTMLRDLPVGHRDRGAWLDNFCTWALFCGDRRFFPEAELLSRELCATRGGELTVQGTRASMLALVGRWDEAETMLGAVVAESASALDRAISAAVLAWINYRQGRLAAVQKWAEAARRYNEGSFPIPWMEEEMRAPRESP